MKTAKNRKASPRDFSENQPSATGTGSAKKRAAVLLSLSLILGLSACGAAGGGTETTEAEESLTKITFCLDWTPNTNHTGIYAAQALGYYEEAGLDVEIVQPPEDGAAILCAAGQAQFAVDAQDTLAAAFDSDEPLGVTAVAALMDHNTSGILSRAGDGIDRPKGLEGKSYSTWQAATELAMLRQVMSDDGGDFDKVTLIPNDITDEPAALSAGQTDAVWVFYGWSVINAECSGMDYDFWYFKDINPVFDYYTPILIANDDFLEDSPDIAEAFLEATAKGYAYAAAEPEEAAELLIAGDDTGSLNGSEELVIASQEWISSQMSEDASSWGIIDAERWDAFYGWLYENGLTGRDLTGIGYTNDYLPK